MVYYHNMSIKSINILNSKTKCIPSIKGILNMDPSKQESSTHTCSMENCPPVLVLLECVRGLMFQQHFHTWGKASLSSQVEGSSAFNVPYIQTH